ncbi:2TM domain-containing protein [Flavobacterium weaverense]|uniref:2TM domain-containing protein n=1 Tax=Flavobacterium weaverense TaxID=271156 RepID=A0A3M0A1G9_9FLAO|nr:2TM domain-containing protein [Flavobacterium weaverense]RMA78244.1 2TM domain-containing protein [Flavobacterium weaverense]
MKRLDDRMYNSDQFDRNNPDPQYEIAYKRVKKIKGFYTHVMVYILVNAFLIILSTSGQSFQNGDFLNWETYSTAFFWGIGLLAHGLSVFGRSLFFDQDWEQKKIKEFMEKEKSTKWE